MLGQGCDSLGVLGPVVRFEPLKSFFRLLPGLSLDDLVQGALHTAMKTPR